MKFTTKIVIGVIATIFALSILFIVYAAIEFNRVDDCDSYSNRRYERAFYTIPQSDMQTVDLSPFRVIYLEDDHSKDIRVEGTLNLHSSEEGKNENKLTIAKNMLPYIKHTVVGDTLKIKVNKSAIQDFCKDKQAGNTMGIRGLNINIISAGSEIRIANNLSYFTLTARNVNARRVGISNNDSNVDIGSCKIGQLNILNGGDLTISKCRIDTLDLDLDYVRGWNIVHSKVDVENLTGSNHHSIRQSKTESNTVNWTPKNKSAELNITVPNDTVRIIFP